MNGVRLLGAAPSPERIACAPSVLTEAEVTAVVNRDAAERAPRRWQSNGHAAPCTCGGAPDRSRRHWTFRAGWSPLL